jgi:hypothetical protein
MISTAPTSSGFVTWTVKISSAGPRDVMVVTLEGHRPHEKEVANCCAQMDWPGYCRVGTRSFIIGTTHSSATF